MSSGDESKGIKKPSSCVVFFIIHPSCCPARRTLRRAHHHHLLARLRAPAPRARPAARAPRCRRQCRLPAVRAARCCCLTPSSSSRPFAFPGVDWPSSACSLIISALCRGGRAGGGGATTTAAPLLLVLLLTFELVHRPVRGLVLSVKTRRCPIKQRSSGSSTDRDPEQQSTVNKSNKSKLICSHLQQ